MTKVDKSVWAVALAAALCALAMFAGGCATPDRVIATGATTVNAAMRAWVVWVVDGRATLAQEETVREALERYHEAEDVAVAALAIWEESGDKSAWLRARAYLRLAEERLVTLIELFTREKTP